jgi:hypothetical protein
MINVRQYGGASCGMSLNWMGHFMNQNTHQWGYYVDRHLRTNQPDVWLKVFSKLMNVHQPQKRYF